MGVRFSSPPSVPVIPGGGSPTSHSSSPPLPAVPATNASAARVANHGVAQPGSTAARSSQHCSGALGGAVGGSGATSGGASCHRHAPPGGGGASVRGGRTRASSVSTTQSSNRVLSFDAPSYLSRNGATSSSNGVRVPGSPTSDDSQLPGEEQGGSGAPGHGSGTLASSLPLRLLSIREIKCPICNKIVAPGDVERHLIACLSRPRLSYNEDLLTEDKDLECVICLEELCLGDTIARLPCLCIYHKSCIDRWFRVNRCCPEHPGN